MHARSPRIAAHTRRWLPPAALAAAAATGLAGCGTSRSGAGSFNPSGDIAGTAARENATAAPADPGALPTEQTDRLVLRSYSDYQRAYRTAYERNDPSGLPAVATDPILTSVTNDIEEMRAKGVIWRFANVYNPRVYARSSDGRYVYVVDCVRTLAGYRYSAKTGKRLGGGPGTAYRYRTTLAYEGTTWKVSNTKRDTPC